MSEERLSSLIEDFNYRNLNLFFRSKCENYAEAPEDLSQYDDEKFSDFRKLGEIRFDSGDKLVITSSLVSGDPSERSGKKAQYEKAKKILKELALYDTGFFIFYDSSGSFRFSLVYGQAEGTRKSWSNFRRFTYFVSREQTNNTFKIRVGGCSFSSLEAVKDAFSVEKVNKEFYGEIAKYYYRLTGKNGYKRELVLPSVEDGDARKYEEYTVRLIGRIIFCWFLRHKKSSDGVPLIPREVLSFSAVQDHTDYYHSILEPLFFEVMNRPVKERTSVSVPQSALIPFLNGGLFEPHVNDYFQNAPNYALKIPDRWFLDFFSVLEQYNFTIDENSTVDADVSVDPEMLGRIFENLLAEVVPETGETARKATGSYYTPRAIVDYMVEQSLKQYLITKTGLPEDTLNSILSYEDNGAELDDAEKNAIVKALKEIKVVDPACGSGAFPMGILHRMLLVLEKVDPSLETWKRLYLSTYHPVMRKIIEDKLRKGNEQYIRKLTVIQDSIYGVDVQPIAVEIAKLRCFLSLVVDELVLDNDENRGIEPLPNLEFKFVAANTLIGLPKATSQTAFGITETIDKLKELRESYLRSFGAEKLQIEKEFRATQQKLFKENVQWAVADTLVKQLTEWDPFSYDSCDWFDPGWMFGEDSFDIVIANPPWGVDLSKETKLLLKEGIPEIDSSTPNSFAYFIGIANKISRLNVAFILPDSILIKDYAKTRKLIAPKLLSLDWYQNTSVPENYRPFVYVEHDVCVIIFDNENEENIRCCKHEYDPTVKSVIHNEWTAQKNEMIFPEYDYVLNLMLEEKDRQIHDKLLKYETVDSFVQCHEGIHTGNSRDILFIKGKKNEYCKPLYYGGRAGDYIANYVSKTSGWYVDYRTGLIDKDRGYYASLRDENIFRYPKIYITRTGNPFKCFYDENTYASNNFFSLQFKNRSENIKENLLVLLCIINSKLTQFFIRTFAAPRLGDTYIETKIIHLLKVRAPRISKELKDNFLPVIYQILAMRERNLEANTANLETEIDKMVYTLYGLTPEEIAVVEGKK